MYTISVAKSFSRFPAGRYTSDGPHSGQRFRDDFLVPAMRKPGEVTIDLDGTLGYGSSFLEEAFGGMVRLSGFSASEIHAKFVIKSRDRSLINEIWKYVDEAIAKGKTTNEQRELGNA